MAGWGPFFASALAKRHTPVSPKDIVHRSFIRTAKAILDNPYLEKPVSILSIALPSLISLIPCT